MNYPILRETCSRALQALQTPAVGGALLLVVRSGRILPARGVFTDDGDFSREVRVQVNRSHRTWVDVASATGRFMDSPARLQAICRVGSANLALEERRAEHGKKKRVDVAWKAALLEPWVGHVSSLFFGSEDQTAEDLSSMLLMVLAHHPKATYLNAFLSAAVLGDGSLRRVNSTLVTPPALVEVIRRIFVGAEVESFLYRAEARDVQQEPGEVEPYIREAV